MPIQRVTPQPLRCCGGSDRHTVECHLFAHLGPRPSWQTPDQGPVRFVSPPAAAPKESFRAVLFAVFAVVVIVLVVAGVVVHDATSTPATDAATVKPAAAAPGVPVPLVCR